MPKRIIVDDPWIVSHLKENSCYIDNTEIIKSILTISETAPTILITRPIQSGKTSTLALVNTFFSQEKKQQNKYFKQLAIWTKHKSLVNEHYGKYAVIHISFLGLKWSIDKEDFLSDVAEVIREVFIEYSNLAQTSDLIKRVLEREATTEEDLIQSIAHLTQLLKMNGIESILLIDEYDSPIFNQRNHYQRQIITDFIQQFIRESCVNNPNIKFALLAGIHRIAGLPDTIHHSALLSKNFFSDPMYYQIGCNESQVISLLQDFEVSSAELPAVKKWYGNQVNDRYTFNIVSVLNYLYFRTKEPYRIDVINFSLVLETILKAPISEQIDFIKLLKNESIYKRVKTEIDFQQLDFDSGTFYYKLIALGCLVIDKMELNNGDFVGEIKIPNKELYHYFFYSTLKIFLDSKLEKIYDNLLFDFKSISDKLLQKRCKTLCETTLLNSLVFFLESRETKDSLPLKKFQALINHTEEQMNTLSMDYPLELATINEFKEKLLAFWAAQKKYYRFSVENNVFSNAPVMYNPNFFADNQVSQLSSQENEQQNTSIMNGF